MSELALWFTKMEHSKPFALVLFFVTFIGIVLYVYANRKRGERLESYKNIPLEDDDADRIPHHKEKDDE